MCQYSSRREKSYKNGRPRLYFAFFRYFMFVKAFISSSPISAPNGTYTRNRQSHYRSVPGTDICQNTTLVHSPRSAFTGCGSTLHTLLSWFDFVVTNEVANRNPCAFHDIFSSSVYRMFSSRVGCSHSSIRLLLVSSRAPS